MEEDAMPIIHCHPNPNSPNRNVPSFTRPFIILSMLYVGDGGRESASLANVPEGRSLGRPHLSFYNSSSALMPAFYSPMQFCRGDLIPNWLSTNAAHAKAVDRRDVIELICDGFAGS